MSLGQIFIIIWIIFMFCVIAFGLSDNFRRFVSRKFDNWSYKRRQRKRLFKRYSKHIKKYDWLKFYSSAVIIFLGVIIISGVLSHFGAVSKAKEVCYARLGLQDCETKSNQYEYFIPGTKASIFDFPYKLGIAYECECDGNEKTIIMSMATKVKVEKEKDETKTSSFSNTINKLFGISNST